MLRIRRHNLKPIDKRVYILAQLIVPELKLKIKLTEGLAPVNGSKLSVNYFEHDDTLDNPPEANCLRYYSTVVWAPTKARFKWK